MWAVTRPVTTCIFDRELTKCTVLGISMLLLSLSKWTFWKHVLFLLHFKKLCNQKSCIQKSCIQSQCIQNSCIQKSWPPWLRGRIGLPFCVAHVDLKNLSFTWPDFVVFWTIFDRELTKCAVLGICMLLLLLASQNWIFVTF